MIPMSTYRVDTEARDRFLNLLPLDYWTWAANLMTMPILALRSAGLTITPGELVQSARHVVAGRLLSRKLETDQKDALEELRDALTYDRAYDYAGYLIAFEAGHDTKTIRINKYVAKNPPTVGQVKELRRLEYTGPMPVNCREAWLLIDRVKKYGGCC